MHDLFSDFKQVTKGYVRVFSHSIHLTFLSPILDQIAC